jgi:wyosine [tRNA(Phe)-imidazoG37] synthetase (radical SAM superfamily)
MTMDRTVFYNPEQVFEDVRRKVIEVESKNERIDYLTFVPDGEPTLDLNLENLIELMQGLDIPLAVLTNSSLLWKDDVREMLCNVDLVSLKIDAVSENLWREIDRPHRSLQLEQILDGIMKFSDMYNGTIITETMLLNGVQYDTEFERIARFLAELKVNKAYIAIPTRPPAEEWVKPSCEDTLNRAFYSFSENLASERIEFLIGYEGNAFSSTGNLETDLLSITSVHPMREDAVRDLVDKSGASWDIIDNLIESKKIIELTYLGKKYFMRSLVSRDSNSK